MRIVLLIFFVAGSFNIFAQSKAKTATAFYENNFDKADKIPEDMMVMEGGFRVVEEQGNKFLELPGAPLETFGVLFGPTETNGISVSARIFGTARGRRFPTFAVGLNGVGGYKLQVSPAKKLIELYRGDELLTSAPCQWDPGSWTLLRLQSRRVKEDELSVQGKAWKQGAAEPKEWMISHVDKTEPPPGRASIWGAPYSGTPIRFDDLTVNAAR